MCLGDTQHRDDHRHQRLDILQGGVMSFWSLLDDFWSPLEDMVVDCQNRQEAAIRREIRHEHEETERKRREQQSVKNR